MDRYIVRDRETGTFIASFDTIDECVEEIKRYERDDYEMGCFEPDFYEVAEYVEDIDDYRTLLEYTSY